MCSSRPYGGVWTISTRKVLNDTHDARRLHTVAIARNSHEIDVGRQLDLAHQVAHKDHGAAQDRNQHQILTRVVASNLLA